MGRSARPSVRPQVGAVRLHPQLGTLPVRGRRVARADRPGRPECRDASRPSGSIPAPSRPRPRSASTSPGCTPKGYDAVAVEPDLVVSVCDRAHEAGFPFAAPAVHWSIPDPVPGRDDRGLPPGVRRHRRRGSTGSPRQALDRRHLHDNEDPIESPATSRSLTPAERVSLRHSATALERRWKGQMNVETIERFMAESLDIILPRARVRTWVPVLVERLTNDRLRALVRLESDRTDLNPSVLFLCVHNAGRSQMAAGWMRHLAGRAGGRLLGRLRAGRRRSTAAAVAAMAREGHRHQPRAPPAVGRRDRPRGRRRS